MSYIGSAINSAVVKTENTVTATAGQTSFTGLSYNPAALEVYLNGVKLLPGTSYTATDGTTITLAVAANLGDVLNITSNNSVNPTLSLVNSVAGTTLSRLETSVAATSAGQTLFTGFTYTPGSIDVFLNGVKLQPADYIATNGTSVSLTAGASIGQIVTVLSYNQVNTQAGLGGGATGGAGDTVFFENSQVVNNSYTLTAGKNAISAGPITIADTKTVVIPTGASWAIC
jgi:hypothetical protein